MKLTRSQQISFAVLGLAVSAYLGDRIFGGSPVHAARGGQMADSAAMAIEPIDTAIGSQSIRTADMSLNEKLSALAKSRRNRPELRDAFSTAAWFGGKDQPTMATNARIADFPRLHHLKAIISTDGVGQAIVDETLVRVGQYFDGLQLEAASGTRAVFTANGVRVELRIEEPW